MIPIISGFLYWVGGQYWKIARWVGIGLSIGLIRWNGWIDLGIVIGLYFIATNIFSYGDKSWTTKLFGRWVSMGLAGLTMGLASIVVLGAFWGVIQGIIGLISFLILKYLDDSDKLKNPWQELLRGFFGTIVYFWR